MDGHTWLVTAFASGLTLGAAVRLAVIAIARGR